MAERWLRMLPETTIKKTAHTFIYKDKNNNDTRINLTLIKINSCNHTVTPQKFQILECD
jgi:hypothetical protein